MRGYINEPEETAAAIDADGWFHTGDIGELDEIGRIKITDRLKNIIVLANGKNVSPAPMEASLGTSKYIAQAIILGDRQPYTGALVAPDFEELERWAAANGIAEMPPEQLIEERSVQKLIDGEVKAKLEGFAIFERPRRVVLLPACSPRRRASSPRRSRSSSASSRTDGPTRSPASSTRTSPSRSGPVPGGSPEPNGTWRVARSTIGP